jgi:UDP-glucuronate decarboxylase
MATLSNQAKKILITGGTGFFGRALLRNLLASDYKDIEFIILSRQPEKFLTTYPLFANSAQFQFVQSDIQDRSSLPWDCKLSHILHAATDSTIGPRLSPLQRFQQIVEGTTNILDLALATGAKRFLLTSSGGIYGQQPPDLLAIPEDWAGSPTLADPATAYSQAKRAAEHLCALYQDSYGLQTVIARCFAFIGPDLPLDVHFAIGNFIYDALHSQTITVAGDGTPLRTYLDQSDLAHWLWTLLQEGTPGEAFNVGSDEVVSIAELAHLVRDLAAPDKPVRILGHPTASSSRNRYVPDITKARDMHSLKVNIPLSTAILQTVRAHQNT